MKDIFAKFREVCYYC